jgi:hypothetical protein
MELQSEIKRVRRRDCERFRTTGNQILTDDSWHDNSTPAISFLITLSHIQFFQKRKVQAT